MRTIPFLAFLFACSETPGGGGTDVDGGDDWQPVSYLDEGEVCFSDQGAQVAVTVTAPDCLSSSCSRDLAGACEAVLDGSTITVTSDIHWEQNVGEDIACTEDCGIPSVECTMAELPDGIYTVVIGGVESELVIPQTEPCYGY